jgi:hypothetical protein
MIFFENHATVLTDTVLASIENMAFADIEPLSETLVTQERFHTVHISLGDLGNLDMAIDPSALDGLASVILTVDPSELDDSSKRDTLMEIINIVAGRFCHDLVQAEGEFKLGLPELGLVSGTDSEGTVVRAFAMDGDPAIQFRYFPVRKVA